MNLDFKGLVGDLARFFKDIVTKTLVNLPNKTVEESTSVYRLVRIKGEEIHHFCMNLLHSCKGPCFKPAFFLEFFQTVRSSSSFSSFKGANQIDWFRFKGSISC